METIKKVKKIQKYNEKTENQKSTSKKISKEFNKNLVEEISKF